MNNGEWLEPFTAQKRSYFLPISWAVNGTSHYPEP